MTRLAPLWQQNSTYPAATDRSLLAALWPASASSGGAATLVSNTMTVSVAAGFAAVAMVGGNYTELCRWDAPEVVTLDPAPAAGQSRIDLVIVQVRDQVVDAGANNDFLITKLTGTPAPSNPVAPAPPNNAYALCQVLVPGNVPNLNTATLVDRRVPLSPRDAAHARVARGAVYTITTAPTPIAFDTIVRDPLGMYSIANKYFVTPLAGVYLITATAYAQATAAGQQCTLALSHNFVTAAQGGAPQSSGAFPLVTSLTSARYCAAGDALGINISASVALSSQYADPTITFASLNYLGAG